MLDTSSWKDFRIGDLFDIINNPQLDKENFVFGEKSEYPYFTRTENNNGILGYVDYLDEKHKIQGNSLAVGMISMKFHYMSHDFYAGQFTKTLIPKFDEFNERLALYFIAVLNKHSPRYQSELVRHFVNLVNNTVVLLPTTPSGEPDWDFMTRYIAELEEERVAELEAYLVSTGLDDYELTEGDNEVLSASPEWGEFRIGDLFELEKSKPVLSKMDIKNEGLYPAFSSDTRNNGILGYTDIPDFKVKEGECRVIFGDHTRTMNITREDFSILDNVKILNPYKKDISDECLLYIFTRWKKAVPDRGYARHWKWAKEAEFKLPVLPDGTPDFDYMEKYIRAIEKLTIQGVVEWKDKEIEKTKEIIA